MARFKHIKYPKDIVEDVKMYKETNDGSIFEDADIDALSRDEVFKCIIEWDGLIGYLNKIKTWVRDIYGVDLYRLEDCGTDGTRVEYTLASVKTNKCISRIFYSREDAEEYWNNLRTKNNWRIVSRQVIYKEWS